MFRLTVKDWLGKISNVFCGMDWHFVFIVIGLVILGLLIALLVVFVQQLVMSLNETASLLVKV